VHLQATNNMVAAQVLCFVFVNQYVKELLFLEYLILSVYLKSVGLAFAAPLLFIF
jgi:hypothetical protein